MVFEIKDKVALVSGGAAGLGLAYGKELLKNGLRGLTIADVNEELGKKALKEIEEEFGEGRAIFVKTDVVDKESFEEAFKRTVEVFKNVDILINNAGILDERIAEKVIAVNVYGTLNGTLLGLEHYIPKYKSGAEGVIVNASSIAGIHTPGFLPVYTATKFAVFGMSKAFGVEDHYQRTNVRVLIICPGITQTTILDDAASKMLGAPYAALLTRDLSLYPTQTSEDVAPAVVKIIERAKPGTAWVIEGAEEPYEFPLVPREAYKENTLDSVS